MISQLKAEKNAKKTTALMKYKSDLETMKQEAEWAVVTWTDFPLTKTTKIEVSWTEALEEVPTSTTGEAPEITTVSEVVLAMTIEDRKETRSDVSSADKWVISLEIVRTSLCLKKIVINSATSEALTEAIWMEEAVVVSEAAIEEATEVATETNHTTVHKLMLWTEVERVEAINGWLTKPFSAKSASASPKFYK